MLNNKGFAVSSVLYTLLIAFLLFLGAALAQFSASSSLIGKANDDLINGNSFEAAPINPNGACTLHNGTNVSWYQQVNKDDKIETSGTIVKIKTRYGTMYFPKDFKDSGGIQAGLYEIDGTIAAVDYTSYNGKIKAQVSDGAGDVKWYLKITDVKAGNEAAYPITNGNSETRDKGMGIYDNCK